MSSKKQTHSHDRDTVKQRLPRPNVQGLDKVPQSPPPILAVQRAELAPGSLTSQDVLQLQRTIGNRAVGRLLNQPVQRQPTQNEAVIQRVFDMATYEAAVQAAVNSARNKAYPTSRSLYGMWTTHISTISNVHNEFLSILTAQGETMDSANPYEKRFQSDYGMNTEGNYMS